MNKLDIKYLAPYLPYKLRCVYTNTFGEITEGEFTTIDTSYGISTEHCWDDDLMPILHPLSDLTKPITVKGYNNDKEFIPLVELARTLYSNISWTNCFSLCSFTKGKVVFDAYEMLCSFRFDDKRQEFYVSFDDDEFPPEKQRILYGLLYKWHFDLDNLIENKLAIDINTIQ